MEAALADLDPERLQTILDDGEFVLYRQRDPTETPSPSRSLLVVIPRSEHPRPQAVRMLEHEHTLRGDLDPAWALRPVALTTLEGRPALVLEDPGGELILQRAGRPMDVADVLRVGAGVAAALRQLHGCGLIHKDIKPANLMTDWETGRVWLRGFGIASRLPRERRLPEPPEFIAGTLAYMAPEQTGWMNRSIDARSDLYTLGVVIYELLTGSVPFTASDPMACVHAHIARRPVPPAERRHDIPDVVSAIVMKLLAKTAEDRYQTAAAVERDLRQCLAQWETDRRIDTFALAADDTPDRLVIPETLYGRAREIDTLLGAFERVVTSGTPELVLVSGYAGIGKSSVVNELHKVLVPPRALFASGKFDQYKRDIPYATLAQAFESLIRNLLGKSEPELDTWRAALREALEPNGRLMVDLVPALTLLIGDQPPVPELAPQDAQRRFQLVFRRFIGVFARPDRPLALFLDDLQWLDAGTLAVLADLLTQRDVPHVLLIGAYREDEVDAAHPLRRTLDTIRASGARVQEISLVPLARHDVGQLLADALRSTPARVAPLAQLVHDKTAGNPFFAMQFIGALADDGLLTFDHGQGCWSWDVDRIHAKAYTDNVVDLVVGKLHRLPVDTQEALQQLACLGNTAAVSTLALLRGMSEDAVHADLWEAVRHEVDRAARGRLYVYPRSGPGSGLFPDPGGTTRRGASPHRSAAGNAYASREAGRGDLRDRQSTEPWRGTDHSTRRTRAASRTQPHRRYPRQEFHSVRVGAHLPARGCGIVDGGLLGAPACARVLAAVPPGRMRIPDRCAGSSGGALDRPVNARRHGGRARDRRVLTLGCALDARSERPLDCRRSRLPPTGRHRLVAASDR